MILKELKLWNFRKFKASGEEPGLIVEFHKGLNALVGENDAGKSAIIDAIKLILQTQSGEYVRVTEDDFYTDDKGTAPEFRIECIFTDFEKHEAKNFVEYLTYKKAEDGALTYSLHLHYCARRENSRIIQEWRAGERDDGVVPDSRARELLKCVYLKPLRDATKEMRSGRNSRISQILLNHPVFAAKEGNELVQIFQDANARIKEYFGDGKDGEVVLKTLRSTLQDFSSRHDTLNADLQTSEIRLKPILESLSLFVSDTQPGLGVSNLLFIAAELLLLDSNKDGALCLALIEELEAHLHPQAQLRLIEYLQNSYNASGVQIIISTHSPTLASKINLKSVILVRDGSAYSLAYGKTELEKGDYLFLQRFLDTTKANLFFAKALIMVEGDAENLLLPVIADILGYNLDKCGVSVVNIGSLAFGRYARIFCRKDAPMIRTPIAIVTDCDVKPELKDGKIDVKEEETKKRIQNLEGEHNHELIRTFVAPRWTFEYSVALSCLGKALHRAVLEAKKIAHSNGRPLTPEKIKEVEEEMVSDPTGRSAGDEFAYHVYQETLLEGGVSKAIVAQCLAAELRKRVIMQPEPMGDQIFDVDLLRVKIDPGKVKQLKSEIEGDEYLRYIVDAIKHVAEMGNG